MAISNLQSPGVIDQLGQHGGIRPLGVNPGIITQLNQHGGIRPLAPGVTTPAGRPPQYGLGDARGGRAFTPPAAGSTPPSAFTPPAAGSTPPSAFAAPTPAGAPGLTPPYARADARGGRAFVNPNPAPPAAPGAPSPTPTPGQVGPAAGHLLNIGAQSHFFQGFSKMLGLMMFDLLQRANQNANRAVGGNVNLPTPNLTTILGYNPETTAISPNHPWYDPWTHAFNLMNGQP